MGSNIVVTYKRKRLFSRIDHSPVNLHSDTSSESAKSKTSDTFPKQEGTTAECTLQNNKTGFGICHAYSKDTIGKDVLQCENHDSGCCSQCNEKHVEKTKMLYSECAEQKYSPVSNETQEFTPKQKCSPKVYVEENTSHLNVLLDGNSGGRYEIDSAGPSKAEDKLADTQSKLSVFKLGSECEENCKDLIPSVSQPPDACSGAEPDPLCLESSSGINCSHQMMGTCIPKTSTTEETDKLHEEQYSSLCNNSGIKRKLASSLITFCRRSKRNRADIASESEMLPAAGCSVDLKENAELPKSNIDNNEEKKIPEDVDNSCSFSTTTQAISMVVLTDNRQRFPHGEAEDAPNASAQCCQDSQEQKIQHKILMDHTTVTTQRLPDECVTSQRMHSDVSGRGDDSLSSLDLTIPPHASHNIDCNLPLDDGCDVNQPVETLEVLHDSFGSPSKLKEDNPTLPEQPIENGSPVRAVSDKGKCILDSPPVLTGNSSRNNYIQFFPDSRGDNMLHLANNSDNVSPVVPSNLQPSNLIGLSLHPDQMVDGRPCFPPSYEWLNVQVQPREPFPNLQLSTSDRAQSFSRDKMMLDTILTRARAVRGNRSSFLDKFDYPTTWLEEELDSLWIGVRRHGRGNWDAILGDRRLHFLPWKTPRDLSERWQVEQSRLICSMPISQRRYASPPDFSSENVSSLHQLRPEGQVDEVRLSLGHSHPIQRGPPPHFMNHKMSRHLQKPVANSGSGCWGLTRDEASSTAALMNGCLPHWLRTTAEIPPGPSRPTQTVPSGCHSGIAWLNQPTFNCPGTSQQSWLSNRYISTQGRPEPQNGGKAPCSSPPVAVEREKTQPDTHRGNEQEDLIIIPSDASSEETISDDHSIRP